MLIAALAVASIWSVSGLQLQPNCSADTVDPCHGIDDPFSYVTDLPSFTCLLNGVDVSLRYNESENSISTPESKTLPFTGVNSQDEVQIWLAGTQHGANAFYAGNASANPDTVQVDLNLSDAMRFYESPLKLSGASLRLLRTRDNVTLSCTIGVDGVQASASNFTDADGRYPEMEFVAPIHNDSQTLVSEAIMIGGSATTDADARGFYRFAQMPTGANMPACRSKGGVLATFLIGGFNTGDTGALSQHVHTSGDVSHGDLMGTLGHYYGFQEFARNISSKQTEVGLLHDGGSFALGDNGVAFGGFFDCQAQLQGVNDINGRAIVVHRGGSPRRVQGVVARVDEKTHPMRYQVGALLFNGTTPVAHVQQTVFDDGSLWKVVTVKHPTLSEAETHAIVVSGETLLSAAVSESDGASEITKFTNHTVALIGERVQLETSAGAAVARGVFSNEAAFSQHAAVSQTECNLMPTPVASATLPKTVFFKSNDGRIDLAFEGMTGAEVFKVGVTDEASVGMFQAATEVPVALTQSQGEYNMSRGYFDRQSLSGETLRPGSVVTLSVENEVHGVCVVEASAAFPQRPILPSTTPNPSDAPTEVCPTYWRTRLSDDRVRLYSDEYERELPQLMANPTSSASQVFVSSMETKFRADLGWTRTTLFVEFSGECYAMPTWLPSDCADAATTRAIYAWRASNNDLENTLAAVAAGVEFVESCKPNDPSSAMHAQTSLLVAAAAVALFGAGALE